MKMNVLLWPSHVLVAAVERPSFSRRQDWYRTNRAGKRSNASRCQNCSDLACQLEALVGLRLEPVAWRATNKIVLCIKKLETRRTSALARRARILAAVYSGSVLPFADVLSMLGERLEVLHVL